MKDTGLDLATAIGTNVSAVTLGTDVFDGPVRPPEDEYATEACFCIESGGRAAEPDNGKTTRAVFAEVQVRTRGNKDEYASGKTFTDSIFSYTEHATISGYINVRNLTAAPIYIGTDAGGRHEWSYTVEMFYEDTP